MIYFITDGYFVKVGTAKCLKSRLSQMKSGNPMQLQVLATCDGDHALEQSLHRTIKGRASGGLEWYHPTRSLLNLIRRVQDSGVAVVHARITAARRLRRISRNASKRAEAQWKIRSTALLSELCRKHGVRKISQVTGLTESAIRMNANGVAQLGALGWARIGTIEPEQVNRLMNAERIAA